MHIFVFKPIFTESSAALVVRALRRNAENYNRERMFSSSRRSERYHAILSLLTSLIHSTRLDSPTKTLRVVDRTWQIFNSDGDLSVEVKRSVGLVGMTPTLMPGSSFEYYSGTDLESRTGRMEGKFGCIVVGEEGDEETFDANVPPLIFE